MFYSNFMVMSFPFITMVEYNEKAKKNKQLDAKQLDTKQLDAKQYNIRSLCPEKSNKTSTNEKQSIKNDCDMIFLSNLEEVVFHTSSSKCLMRELLPETKNTQPVEYDKYLEFFE